MSIHLQARVEKMHRQRGAPPFRLDVDAEFAPGVTAIFGVSGSGKSTWLECIAGLQRPDAGTIELEGKSLFDHQSGVNVLPALRGMGYIFQNAALFPHMTVRANVEYGLHALPAAQRRTAAQQSLDSFRIAHLAEKNAQTISGGERQRVALARALVRAPRCLLLDEPFSALDYVTKLQIMDDVLAWNGERRIPVLLVTHALEEVLAMAEHVIVLDEGRVIMTGEPQAILAPQRERLLARLQPPAPDSRDLLS